MGQFILRFRITPPLQEPTEVRPPDGVDAKRSSHSRRAAKRVHSTGGENIDPTSMLNAATILKSECFGNSY